MIVIQNVSLVRMQRYNGPIDPLKCQASAHPLDNNDLSNSRVSQAPNKRLDYSSVALTGAAHARAVKMVAHGSSMAGGPAILEP